MEIHGTAELIPDEARRLPHELSHKYLGVDPPLAEPDVVRLIVRITPERSSASQPEAHPALAGENREGLPSSSIRRARPPCRLIRTAKAASEMEQADVVCGVADPESETAFEGAFDVDAKR